MNKAYSHTQSKYSLFKISKFFYQEKRIIISMFIYDKANKF